MNYTTRATARPVHRERSVSRTERYLAWRCSNCKGENEASECPTTCKQCGVIFGVTADKEENKID